MQSIVLVIHVLLSMTVIGLVLIQHGKGADAGAAFGSGASATVFGAKGSASFLTRLTTWAAVAFFITSLTLFYLAAHRDTSSGSVVEGFELPANQAPDTQGGEIPAAVPAQQERSQSELPAAPQPVAPEVPEAAAPAAGDAASPQNQE